VQRLLPLQQDRDTTAEDQPQFRLLLRQSRAHPVHHQRRDLRRQSQLVLMAQVRQHLARDQQYHDAAQSGCQQPNAKRLAEQAQQRSQDGDQRKGANACQRMRAPLPLQTDQQSQAKRKGERFDRGNVHAPSLIDNRAADNTCGILLFWPLFPVGKNAMLASPSRTGDTPLQRRFWGFRKDFGRSC
jgi:FtsZ-interacting cell division protein ZipA